MACLILKGTTRGVNGLIWCHRPEMEGNAIGNMFCMSVCVSTVWSVTAFWFTCMLRSNGPNTPPPPPPCSTRVSGGEFLVLHCDISESEEHKKTHDIFYSHWTSGNSFTSKTSKKKIPTTARSPAGRNSCSLQYHSHSSGSCQSNCQLTKVEFWPEGTFSIFCGGRVASRPGSLSTCVSTANGYQKTASRYVRLLNRVLEWRWECNCSISSTLK